MKYIITERQKNDMSKTVISTFQKAIDISMLKLKRECDRQDMLGAETDNVINFEACDEISVTESIEVTAVDFVLGSPVVFLNFHKTPSHGHHSDGDSIKELKHIIRRIIGPKVVLVFNDVINI